MNHKLSCTSGTGVGCMLYAPSVVLPNKVVGATVVVVGGDVAVTFFPAVGEGVID